MRDSLDEKLRAWWVADEVIASGDVGIKYVYRKKEPPQLIFVWKSTRLSRNSSFVVPYDIVLNYFSLIWLRSDGFLARSELLVQI